MHGNRQRKKKVLFRPASHSTCVADQKADTAGYEIAELGKRGSRIGGIANALACKPADDEVALLGTALTQLGDTLLTIATQRAL